MRGREQNSIFSAGGKFRPDYGLLLELHTLTRVTRSYALLVRHNHSGYTYTYTTLSIGSIVYVYTTLRQFCVILLQQFCANNFYVVVVCNLIFSTFEMCRM